MKYIQQFYKEADYNRKSKKIQPFLDPIRVGRYFILTRIAALLKKPIPWRAKLFFNQTMTGIFPEPVFSFLYFHHFIEEDVTRMILKYVKPGQTFLDLGSHIGYFSVLASFQVGEKGHVFAFEATPSTFEILKENTKNLKNVTAVNCAVWSEETKINFLDYGSFYSSCNSFTEGKLSSKILKAASPKKIKIQAVSIDDYCKEHKLVPNFVKIDVESAEYQALEGMKKTILKYKPIISVEIGDKEIKGIKTTRDCINFLENLGYKYYSLEGKKFIKHKIQKDYKSCFGNILFLPQG